MDTFADLDHEVFVLLGVSLGVHRLRWDNKVLSIVTLSLLKIDIHRANENTRNLSRTEDIYLLQYQPIRYLDR